MVQVEDLRMMVGGIQERPGGTGGGPEDDGGWNTGETRWYRWRRMMAEDDGGWNTGETRWYRWRT